jgi:hypothetical protein
VKNKNLLLAAFDFILMCLVTQTIWLLWACLHVIRDPSFTSISLAIAFIGIFVVFRAGVPNVGDHPNFLEHF